MGNLKGNLGDPRLAYDYANRETGTIEPDNRATFRWVSEIAYKNVHRIVSRGYDTTELVEAGYGFVDMLFVDFQARIPLIEEEQMLNYILILSLDDGLSVPAIMSRMVAKTKTFLAQACGAAILAFGHAYGGYSEFGNTLEKYLARAEKEGKSLAEMARVMVEEKRDSEALGVSELMLDDPAAKRLVARAEKLGVAGKNIAFLKEMAKVAPKVLGRPVDIDMLGATGAAMMDLGFSPEAAWAIIAATRSFAAGAHYIEEVEREGSTRLGETLTPQDWYDGQPDRAVPSLAERDKTAKSAQTHSPEEWKKALEERKKIRGSGFAIVEEIEDPSKKAGGR
jgi:citrate synthase